METLIVGELIVIILALCIIVPLLVVTVRLLWRLGSKK